MIDAYSRLSVSVFLTNKKPKSIVHHVMKNWLMIDGYERQTSVIKSKIRNVLVR